ncbi:hypothetical protein M8J77_005614 [Diaphorina citri]|nr:hypothetical protein M8J77_005614 [Diaphorina citri]
MTSENSFEILIGTYEEFVLGYQLIKSEDEENKYTLTQTFVTHSHTASVRSVAATSKLAASSGADETVVLYDMVKRKQSGALMQHEGTITCLKFTPEGSHLISCSDDGSIAIFRVGSWQLEKLFKKAHKGTAVNHISIHPSGKLALSVGKDKTLRTWNLVKGRSAYITNLSSYGVGFENLDSVVWSPEGLLYAIPIQNKAVVFSVEKAGVLQTLKSESKVHSVCFLNETTVCTGNEESAITAYNLTDGSHLWQIKASASRIKGLASHRNHLICITSAGDLVVWELNEDVTREPQRVSATNDGCRFTCLAIRPPVVSDDSDPSTAPPRKKKKKKSIPTPSDSITKTENTSEIEVINVSISEGVKSQGSKSRVSFASKSGGPDEMTESNESQSKENGVSIQKKSLKRKVKVGKKGVEGTNDDGISNAKKLTIEGSGVSKAKKVLQKTKGQKNGSQDGVKEEFVDMSMGVKKKKKVDQAKMLEKKKKRQGKIRKG